MSKTYIFLILLLFCCLSIGINGLMYYSRTKVAYVKSQDLINRYRGTIEANSKFEAKKNQLAANVDSMEVMFVNTKKDYLEFKNKMSVEQRNEQERDLQLREQQLGRYRSAVEDKLQEEESEMMEGVLGQINSFIEQYARKHNYDIILGTTLSGSLLYAKPEMDLTDELVDELNRNFSGK